MSALTSGSDRPATIALAEMRFVRVPVWFDLPEGPPLSSLWDPAYAPSPQPPAFRMRRAP